MVTIIEKHGYYEIVDDKGVKLAEANKFSDALSIAKAFSASDSQRGAATGETSHE